MDEERNKEMRQKEAKIRAALAAHGDTHIVDEAEGFELVQVLGQGTFGQAELRRVPRTNGASEGSFIVVKRVPFRKMDEWSIGSLLSEVTNGSNMRHRFIVRMYGAYLSRQSELCIALQYAAGGTLWDTIEYQRAGRGAFPEEFVTAWLTQLCSAVDYMHDHHVLHRDISTPNIFLSFYGEILLGDLGLSRQLTGDRSTKVGTQVGTPPYMSPELVTGQDYGTSSDVWAVGIVLFEMLALQRPFDGRTIVEVATQISRGELSAAKQEALRASGHSMELQKLASCEGLLNPAPSRRTELKVVLETYPVEQRDKAESEASEAALANLLAGPLRPIQRGLSFKRQHSGGVSDDSPSSSFGGETSECYGRDARSRSDSSVLRRSVEGSIGTSNLISDPNVTRPVPFAHSRAAVPAECPGLPVAFQPRPDLFNQLLGWLLRDTASTGLAGASVAFGMGGTGKTVCVASLMRNPIVAERYERLCWLPVGQTPDLRRLLALLTSQLLLEGNLEQQTDGELGDLLSLQRAVADAARGRTVLCVLDDVWDPAHARILGEALGGSVLLVTTRLHHLLHGAHHIHCGLLTRDESLQLLLRAGALPPTQTVPQAALEAIELCGRLPLALALAGAMVQEYADSWERKLVPLLKNRNRTELLSRSVNEDGDGDDDGDGSDTVEQRVIMSSLSLLRTRKQHHSVALFMFCAVFPEDATIAMAVFDALQLPFERLVEKDRVQRQQLDERKGAKHKGMKHDNEWDSKAPTQARPRRCIKVLLETSLLQGSIQDGVSMHDLLRAFSITHIGPSVLEGLHHDVLEALCDAIGGEVDDEVAAYARAHLEHHAAGACASCSGEKDDGVVSMQCDHPVLRIATRHKLEWVRLAVTRGVGLARISGAAQAAVAAEQWLTAGRLWIAAATLPAKEGESRWEAWCALRRVEPLTAESLDLEATVIRGLVLKKGMRINSPEHMLVNERLKELCGSDLGQKSATLCAARDSSVSMFHFAWLCEASGMQQSRDFLDHYEQFFRVGGVRVAAKLGATQEAARACSALQQMSHHTSLLHTLDGYKWEAEYGPGGSWLRQLIRWYKFEEHHKDFKATNGRDTLLSGIGSAMLQLRWGCCEDDELQASTWRSCIRSWAEISSKVHEGKSTWRNYRIDLVDMRAARAVALSIGRREDACRLFEASPEGVFFTLAVLPSISDDGKGMREERRREATEKLALHVESLDQYKAHWRIACTWTASTFELLARALGTLFLLEGARPEDAALRGRLARAAEQWLPPPMELLALAAAEKAWDVFMNGLQHPVLACASVAASIGRLDDARAVTEGVLRFLRQPLVRIEAHRLLARCAHGRGEPSAAQSHLESAISEASGAGYTWLEQVITEELRSGTISGIGQGEEVSAEMRAGDDGAGAGADESDERGVASTSAGHTQQAIDEPAPAPMYPGGVLARAGSWPPIATDGDAVPTKTLRSALVRDAAKAASSKGKLTRKVSFHTETPHAKWNSEVSPGRLRMLFKPGEDDAGASSAPLGDLIAKKPRPFSALPSKHVVGVGAVDDSHLAAARKRATEDSAERFVRTNRKVKSLNLRLN